MVFAGLYVMFASHMSGHASEKPDAVHDTCSGIAFLKRQNSMMAAHLNRIESESNIMQESCRNPHMDQPRRCVIERLYLFKGSPGLPGRLEMGIR